MSKLQILARVVPAIARDVMGLSGVGLIVAGVDQLSQAAALMVAGAFAIAAASIWARLGR